MIVTDKTLNGSTISYEIAENGYSIYLDGQLWITQYDQYSKPMDETKTIEENCLLQIEDLTRPIEEQATEEDYQAALAEMGVDLNEEVQA